MLLGAIALIISVLLILAVVGCIVYFYAKLFIRVNKKLKILLAILALFAIGWWFPIGSLEGTWQLQNDFRANPRHIESAPLTLQFFDDGTGIKIDYSSHERGFTWEMMSFGRSYDEELSISGRWHSYTVSFRGFGTVMTIQAVLRGEDTMGRFDTANDFTATYRRSWRN